MCSYTNTTNGFLSSRPWSTVVCFYHLSFSKICKTISKNLIWAMSEKTIKNWSRNFFIWKFLHFKSLKLNSSYNWSNFDNLSVVSEALRMKCCPGFIYQAIFYKMKHTNKIEILHKIQTHIPWDQTHPAMIPVQDAVWKQIPHPQCHILIEHHEAPNGTSPWQISIL